MTTSDKRKYPTLPYLGKPSRPLSIICVRFSDEIDHNFFKSECVQNALNQVIIVDNRNNLFFPNLSSAINEGISQAEHELMAVCHEDLLLPTNWQATFESSLQKLEKQDPDWGVLGIVGWCDNGAQEGHYSDPHCYRDTLGNRAFAEVTRIDEQIIILRRSGFIRPDPKLPSIHNIGIDLPRTARNAGKSTYVVNAPAIHKYADAAGQLIQNAKQSPKIVDRNSFAYRADKAVSDEYTALKWARKPMAMLPDSYPNDPYILVSRGGSGSRLLSRLVQDLGIFLGNEINESGDSLEMVLPIYRTLIRKYRCHGTAQENESLADLASAAKRMIERANTDVSIWGFKLPESILILPELKKVFPNARYIHMTRHSVATCLRRSHMTARLDNQIGRITVPLAYDYANRPRQFALTDTDPIRMAYTTKHQLDTASLFFSSLPREQWIELAFEDLIENPDYPRRAIARHFQLTVKTINMESAIDSSRGASRATAFTQEEQVQVSKILEAN